MIGFMNEKDAPIVTLFRPRPTTLEDLVRRLAQDSRNVRWRAKTYASHAESQMEWRDITDAMMFEVLRTGTIKGDVEPGKYPGEWKLKMAKTMKGQREVGVVTIVIREQKLFIKTVEWEDII
jgi:hypothetical protein